jgi:hypothetical protein
MPLCDARQVEYFGKRLEVDLEKGKWSFDKWVDQEIGTHREIVFCKYGVLGVYDLAHLNHVKSLVVTVARATFAMCVR